MPEPLQGSIPRGFGVKAYPHLVRAELDLKEGRYDAASAQVIQHLRQMPNEPRGTALLGTIALKTGALVQAEQFLRSALSLGASGVDVQRDLASAIYQQERLGEALHAFSFLEGRSADPQIVSLKAITLDKLGRNSDALEVHESLVGKHPSQPQYWIAYGHSLRAAGRTDEAIAAYRRAVMIDDERGEAWWGLANIKSKVLTDDDIGAMETALKRAIDLINVVPLHFALGRAWDDRKDYSSAFHHFSEGNRLRAETINYSAVELTLEVDEFIQRFDPAAFKAAEDRQGEATPVFLISMPRAGSTLLEQMLDRHPEIEAVGELPYIRALLRSALEIHTRRAPIKVPELIERLGPGEAQAFGQDYLNRAKLHRRRNARYFVDKMPMNWSDILFIRKILPTARFIEIRRSAMDCCFSNYVHYFSRAHAASFDQHDIGKCYVDYARLMDHIGGAAPGAISQLRYETLVEDPEAQLRSLCSDLGLPFDSDMLRFYESDRVVRTPSAEQVRRPLNRSGMGAWKPYAQWLGPLRDSLGPLADV